MPCRYASISIDLDNEWSYLKTAGVEGWDSCPGYLPMVVPRIMDCLRRHQLRATFFIVGRDAAQPENALSLRALADAGHEIANHSYDHEPWLHLYDQPRLEREFAASEAAITAATGQRPRGFRGPGFSTSPAVMEMLRARGYDYDASLFPTIIGPLARMYFFMSSKLPAHEKAKRRGLYGGLRGAFRSLRPRIEASGLVTIPVTTMPLFRTPMHLSYVHFLAQRAEWLARLYWKAAVSLCRMVRLGPSLLLHPTDFLDATDVPSLRFFPAMKVPARRKIALVDMTLASLTRHWRTGPLGEHAAALRQHRAISEPSALTPHQRHA